MKEIRFIHAADLHLDSPFVGLNHLPQDLFRRLQESTFTAFERVVDAAIEKNADFVLIAGDLYDGEDRSIKAQARLRKQLERLSNEEIGTFIIHGNHDHLAGNWIPWEMPDGVHIFKEQAEPAKFTAKSGTTAHVYGFSYPKRQVLSRKIGEYEKNPDADFHIGMLHGSEEQMGNSSHQPYAPFSVKELLEKNFDYWALGHIHKRQILHEDPYIVYPGNIQGRNRKEKGKKGCYLVTLQEKGNTRLEFIETADLRWESITVHLDKESNLQSLYSKCIRSMESLLRQKQGVLCEIILKGTNNLPPKLLKTIENGEFLELLQDDFILEDEFIWPYRLESEFTIEPGIVSDESFLALVDQLTEELMQKDAFEKAVSELYSHTFASRYLDELDKRRREDLLKGAKERLLRELAEL